jgi:SOS-response transcriptional repressor LexA
MALPALDERQANACDALRLAILDSKEWTYMRLAEEIGTTYDLLNNMANRRKKPDYAMIEKVRVTMGLPAGWPFRTVDKLAAEKSQIDGELVSLGGTPLKPLPFAGQVAAGEEIWNVDVERRVVMVPDRLADLGDVGFVVEGDSMMPMLKERDTTVFKRRPTPKDGGVFLVKMPNDSLRVKLIAYERHDWYLISLNRKYKREMVPDQAQILGILMGWYRVDGTRETMDLDTEYLRPDSNQLRNFEE